MYAKKQSKLICANIWKLMFARISFSFACEAKSEKCSLYFVCVVLQPSILHTCCVNISMPVALLCMINDSQSRWALVILSAWFHRIFQHFIVVDICWWNDWRHQHLLAVSWIEYETIRTYLYEFRISTEDCSDSQARIENRNREKW